MARVIKLFLLILFVAVLNLQLALAFDKVKVRKTDDSETFKKTIKHNVGIERPKVVDTRFKNWESPGMPVIQIFFNCPVSKKSVTGHLFIIVNKDKQSRTDISVRPDPDIKDNSISVKKHDTNRESNVSDFRKIWLVSPKHELPEDCAIEYIIEPGLESDIGTEKGIENRVIDSLHTFPRFTFLGVECSVEKKGMVLIEPDKSFDDQCLCEPEMPINFLFSSPVVSKDFMENIIIEPNLPDIHVNYGEWTSGIYNNSTFGTLPYYGFSNSPDHKYYIELDKILKGNRIYRFHNKPDKITDIFGRSLSNPVDIRFATDLMPSNYYLRSPAVLEKNIKSDVPLRVTNLEHLTLIYDRITATSYDNSLSLEISPPENRGSTIKVPAQVSKILEGQSGVVKGKIITKTNLDNYSDRNMYFTQITPFHVHVKIGFFNTLIWLTDMSSGKPVSDARVKILKGTYSDLNPDSEILKEGVTDSRGTAILAGTYEIDPDLFLLKAFYDDKTIFVKVEKDEDIALLPLHIYNYDQYNNYLNFSIHTPFYIRYYPVQAWGTTDRGVYRPGDIVKYKIYVRNQTSKSLIPAPKEGYNLSVIDPDGNTLFSSNGIVLSKFGAVDGEFNLPDTCSSGLYRIYLSSPLLNECKVTELLVGGFDPLLNNVITDVDNKYFQAAGKMHLTNIDDGGKYRFGKPSVKYSERDRFVYLRDDDYFNRPGYFGAIAKNKPASTDILVVDKNGKLIAGIPVNVKVEREEIIQTKIKGNGAAFLTEFNKKWINIDNHVLKSIDRPLEFTFIPKKAGDYRITACIKDSKGREYNSQIIKYVYNNKFEFGGGDDNRLDIIAEKSEYSVGDIARYHVKNPFPEAKALITIERYGILKHWVQTLNAGVSVIDVKIEDEFSPGFIMSVVVMSPRIDKILSDSLEDRGKPDYKIGFVKTRINNPHKQLNIEVKPLKEIYKPGDKIRIDLNVITKYSNINAPVELAVVVINKEILTLLRKGRDYFDPYKGLYCFDSYSVENFNILTHLIGLQSFEKPDVFTQGWVRSRFQGNLDIHYSTDDTDEFEGEELLLREFDETFIIKNNDYSQLRSGLKSVAYWNPSIITGTNGRASIEFEAPENNSEWRILAIAVTPTDQMGLGEGHFKVIKEK